MKTYIYEAKTIEDAINKALNELNIAEDNLIIKAKEEKQGLLKKTAKIEVINANEIVDYLKESLNTILNLMNINIFETTYRFIHFSSLPQTSSTRKSRSMGRYRTCH